VLSTATLPFQKRSPGSSLADAVRFDIGRLPARVRRSNGLCTATPTSLVRYRISDQALLDRR
jgi:hypothetical protein